MEDLMMFLIFAICDLMVVLLCRYAFGKRDAYSEGMLLGVHIPAGCLEHPEVEQLRRKSSRSWNMFQWINLAVSLLICFFCFYDFILFIIIWTIWLAEYILVLYYLIISSHRQMYRLKIKNGWVIEENKRIIRIDTAVSSAAGKLAPGWKWHLPILILSAASVFLLLIMNRRDDLSFDSSISIWTLYAVGVGICLLFMATHIAVIHAPNRVYSKNTEVNFSANQLSKRSWSTGLLLASWLNGAAWIYLAISYCVSGVNLPFLCYVVYGILITLEAVALLIPVGYALKKRQTILDSDTEPYYVDDDEYWKKGWYNNPDDRRILVPNRFNRTKYAFNFGRPGARAFIIILTAAILVLVIWVFCMLADLINAEVVFTADQQTFSFEAAGYDCEFDLDEIRSVDLIDALPDDSFTRTNGGSTEKVNIGYFRGKETGECMMFLYNDSTPVLEIRLEDTTVFANSTDSNVTEEWYDVLESALQ